MARPSETQRRKPNRAIVTLAIIARFVLLLVAFASALVLAIAVHLDLPAVRHLVGTEVNGALRNALRGEVRIERIGGLGLGDVTGLDLRILDPEGRQVLLATNVRVSVRLFELAQSLFDRERETVVALTSVAADDLDLNLDADPTKALRIGTAFAAKRESPPPEPATPQGPGVRIEASRVVVGHARIHGKPDGTTPFDGEVTGLVGRLLVDPARVHAEVDRARVETHGLPRHLDPRGNLTGHLELPLTPGAESDVQAKFDGDVGGMPTNAEVRLALGVIDARLDVRDETGDRAQAFVNEVSIEEPIALHLEAHGPLDRVDGKAALAYGNARVEAGALVELGPPLRVRGRVAARHVDLATIASGAPSSDLGLEARGHLAMANERVTGELSVDIAPGRLGNDRVPRVRARGRLDGDTGKVRARIDDSRMPTEVVLDLSPRSDRRAGRRLAAAVSSTIPDLRRVPALASSIAGSAAVRGCASVVFPERRVEGSASLDLTQVSRPGLRVEKMTSFVGVRGTLEHLVLDITSRAKGILVSDVPIGTLDGRGRIETAGKALRVHADVRGREIRRLDDVHASVDASIDGRRVALDARAAFDDAGTVFVRTADIVLGGDAADPRAWARASGQLRVDGELDMGKVTSLVPTKALPVSELQGRLTVQGSIDRAKANELPDVRLHAHTRGLLVLGPAREPTESLKGIAVKPAPAWRSSGIDLGLDLRNDVPSGLTTFSLRTTDTHGMVVALDAKAVLPYEALDESPSVAVLRDRLLGAPISAKLILPRRRIDRLPDILGLRNVRGEIESVLDVSGSLRDPRAHLVARSTDLHAPAMPSGFEADSLLSADYDGRRAQLALRMHAKGRELLDGSSQIDAPIQDILERRPFRWKASGRLRLASFPLESVSALANRQIRGNLSGELVVDDLHKDARVEAALDLAPLWVGEVRYPKASLTASVGRGKLAGRVRIEQREGFLDVVARTGLAWGASIAPKLDADDPVETKIVARSFRAVAIQPIIESVAPAFDGTVDADATVRVDGSGKPTMDGSISFRNGTVQVAILGEELRRVNANIKLVPDGTIKIDDVSAVGVNGELRANAEVKLNGLQFAHASGTIRIPGRRAMDVAIGGQPLGQVSGTVNLTADQSPDGKTTALAIDLPRLSVELPQVSKTGIQQLGEKRNIRVGVYRDPKTFIQLPESANDTLSADDEAASRNLAVDLRLGRVEVQRGNTARVTLTGNPRINVGRETTLTGQINTLRGWIDVQGKRFDIERGTITFDGESPPNPAVLLTAAWTAADNTRVFAEFVGPMNSGKIELRSEPPRPQNELLALILFGTADGANPTAIGRSNRSGGTMQTAIGLGGGLAAQGLTEALDDLTGIQATARVDTTRANNPRPEVEFQLDPKVTISFAHVLGTPPITEPDKNLATIDYRFHKNWSLETTVGDRGKATVDAVWQKRY